MDNLILLLTSSNFPSFLTHRCKWVITPFISLIFILFHVVSLLIYFIKDINTSEGVSPSNSWLQKKFAFIQRDLNITNFTQWEQSLSSSAALKSNPIFSHASSGFSLPITVTGLNYIFIFEIAGRTSSCAIFTFVSHFTWSSTQKTYRHLVGTFVFDNIFHIQGQSFK